MPSGGHNRIPATELIAELSRLARELGETPRLADMRESGRFGAKPYYRAFGSWNAAIEEAGLSPNRQSPAELKNSRRVDVECAVCGVGFSVTQSKFESQDQFCCSYECEDKRRETAYSGEGNPRWDKVEVECHACGETIQRARWNAESRSRFYCSECWGDTSVVIVCEYCGDEKEVKRAHRHQRYCSYSCMASDRTGESHPRWTGGYRDYYGPDWPKQREAALDRDGHECQNCGATEPDLDQPLEVHHIEPVRAFKQNGETDFTAANRLTNLVTLCPSCHLTAEWHETGRQHSH